MKAMLCPKMTLDVSSPRASTALLILRLVVAAAFLQHGWGKITHAFSWMGPDAPVPGLLQGLAAFSEFGGGIALLLGLLTPLASCGLIATMSVAVFFHLSKGDGFVQGYELALVYLCLAIGFLLLGPGRYSVDSILMKKCAKT